MGLDWCFVVGFPFSRYVPSSCASSISCLLRLRCFLCYVSEIECFRQFQADFVQSVCEQLFLIRKSFGPSDEERPLSVRLIRDFVRSVSFKQFKGTFRWLRETDLVRSSGLCKTNAHCSVHPHMDAMDWMCQPTQPDVWSWLQDKSPQKCSRKLSLALCEREMCVFKPLAVYVALFGNLVSELSFGRPYFSERYFDFDQKIVVPVLVFFLTQSNTVFHESRRRPCQHMFLWGVLSNLLWLVFTVYLENFQGSLESEKRLPSGKFVSALKNLSQLLDGLQLPCFFAAELLVGRRPLGCINLEFHLLYLTVL